MLTFFTFLYPGTFFALCHENAQPLRTFLVFSADDTGRNYAWTGFFALFSPVRAQLAPLKNSAQQETRNLYLFLWFAVILIFYSFSSSKLIPYIVPCMPPLAIFIGTDISRMLKRRMARRGAYLVTGNSPLILHRPYRLCF